MFFFRSSLVLTLLSKVVPYAIGIFVVYEILIFGCTRRDVFFCCNCNSVEKCVAGVKEIKIIKR